MNTYQVPWTNRAPTFSSPSPTNTTSTIRRFHATNITISDLDGNSTTVCFWNNKTGTWLKAQQNNSVPTNTTVRDLNTSYANSQLTRYWWKVTAYDGHINVSAVYNFMTIANGTEEPLGNLTEVTQIIYHNLGVIPNYVGITPTTWPGSYTYYWVTNINDSAFTLHILTKSGITFTYMWKAEKI